MRTLLWNPSLRRAFLPYTTYLRGSTCLPGRDRELAILRTAWNAGCDYQWAMHVRIAQGLGITSAEIGHLPAWRDWTWSARESAVLAGIDELDSASRIGDHTWAALASHYEEAQLIEFLVLAGHYRMLAYMMNSVGVRPPEPFRVDAPGSRFLFDRSS